MTSTQTEIFAQKKYSVEITLLVIIGAVIATMTLVTHLTARTDPAERASPPSSTALAPPAFRPLPGAASTSALRPKPKSSDEAEGRSRSNSRRTSDPLEIVIGPSSISGEFRLLETSRTPANPISDKLTLRLRVTSRAMADLVTPFQSTMLEVRPRGADPISPEHPFSYPIPAGNTREEDITFVVPSDQNLDHAVLRIQYYNEQKEIPLDSLPSNRRR